MNRLSIRWRLTLWYVTALSIILITFSVVMFGMIRSHLLARLDAQLVEASGDLTGTIEFARSEVELKERLRRYLVDQDEFSFQVSRKDGTVVVGSPWLVAHRLPNPSDDAGKSLGEVVNLDLPHSGRHRLNTRRVQCLDEQLIIHTITSLSDSYRELWSFLMMLVVGDALALIVALSGGILIAQRAMQPIHRITATAERISSQNLTERVPISNRHDELGRLAMTLNATFNRLQNTIDEMRRFTADAAHELRTPLAVIRTEAEVSLRGRSSLEQFQRVAEVAVDQTTRLSILVNQLLTLSRQDTGLQHVKPEDVALKAVLLDVADSLQISAEQKGIQFIIGEIPDVCVLGDDIALSQLFFNLVDNALKFTPQGGAVTISGGVMGGTIKICVKDTGIGIEQQYLPQIFQRFFRVDAARTDGGTGLGLAICKSILESHHGEIAVESEPGVGSRFTVSLPHKESSSAEIETNQTVETLQIPAAL